MFSGSSLARLLLFDLKSAAALAAAHFSARLTYVNFDAARSG